jgi:hypothetical protein
MFKGEIMRKQFLRFLLVLIGVAGSGIAAKAQDVDQVVVKIRHAFVVGDRTLRVGSYIVGRLIGLNGRELVLSNLDNHASTLVVAAVLEEELVPNMFETDTRFVDGIALAPQGLAT